MGIRCGLLIEDRSGSGKPAKQVCYSQNVMRHSLLKRGSKQGAPCISLLHSETQRYVPFTPTLASLDAAA